MDRGAWRATVHAITQRTGGSQEHITRDCGTALRVPSAGHIWKQGKKSSHTGKKKGGGAVM